MSQAELASALGVHERTIRMWEGGKTEPRRKAIGKLEAIIGAQAEGVDAGLPGGIWVSGMQGGLVPFPAGVFEVQESSLLRAVEARSRGPRGVAMAIVDVSREAREALKEGRVVVADGDAWVLGDLGAGRVFRRSGGSLPIPLPEDVEVWPVVAVFEGVS